MKKITSATTVKNVAAFVFFTIPLNGCSFSTGQYFSENERTSMKMKHHTQILNHQTHQLEDSDLLNSPSVNFRYEEISIE